MSENDRKELSEKLHFGLALAERRMLEEKALRNECIIQGLSLIHISAVVGKDVLAKKTDANVVKALEGAVPGIQMNNSTSMPGIWGSIYVRGRGSLNSGTQPLYVICLLYTS